MNRIFTFVIILMALTACAAPQTQARVDPTATDMPQAGLPNPASVYCEQNGNKLEIRTTDDGSQSGICIFSDGSTCDEWAYYRGECGPAAPNSPTPTVTGENPSNASGGFIPPGTAEEISDWWGVIKSTEPGAQYDDYFEWHRVIIEGKMNIFNILVIDDEYKRFELFLTESIKHICETKNPDYQFDFTFRDSIEGGKDEIDKRDFYDLIILDEAIVAIYFKLIETKELIEFIKAKPDNVELILTGRYCPEELIELADLVTEMQGVKHYYQKG